MHTSWWGRTYQYPADFPLAFNLVFDRFSFNENFPVRTIAREDRPYRGGDIDVSDIGHWMILDIEIEDTVKSQRSGIIDR